MKKIEKIAPKITNDLGVFFGEKVNQEYINKVKGDIPADDFERLILLSLGVFVANEITRLFALDGGFSKEDLKERLIGIISIALPTSGE